MPRKTPTSLAEFSKALLQIHAPIGRENLPSAAMEAIRTIVPGDLLAFNEFGPNGVIAITDQPVEEQAIEVFAAYMDEHPSLNYLRKTGSRESVRISDFLTSRQWQGTNLYKCFFGELGLNYQIGFVFSAGPLSIGFSINRVGCDFSKGEKELLDLLIPHLTQAWTQAEACARQQAALSCLAVIEVDGDGRIRQRTAGAERWLSTHFPSRSAGHQLPEEIARWLRHVRTRRQSSVHPTPPLSLDRPDRLLVISVLASAKDDVYQLLLEEKDRELAIPHLDSLGLTPRQSEVLLWASQGKTNAEIGIILGCKARTVDKHMERIMAKLGVETRTAAAAAAFRRMA